MEHYKLTFSGVDQNYSVANEGLADVQIITFEQFQNIKAMLLPKNDDFKAVLYDKDKNEKWGLGRAEYEALKATGEWHDSHKAALESVIKDLNSDAMPEASKDQEPEASPSSDNQQATNALNVANRRRRG